LPPRQPSIETRERLLEAAFTLLEEEGPEALKARTVTRRIDTSTMALYTHFGGMPGLVDAMIREGMVRFAAHVRGRVTETDDPVADLIAGGLAYGGFAAANSQLYRLMFGLTGTAALVRGAQAERPGDVWATPEGTDFFSILLGLVERAIQDGRFRPQEARAAATQILGATHGLILLAVGGFLGDPDKAMTEVMVPLTINLMVGLGDDRESAERSFSRALSELPQAAS
jgi:AcrR family transcriptional regulator